MLYRDNKTFVKGGFYHVFNRGVNKQPIFIETQDYRNFTRRIKICLGLEPKGKLNITAFPPNSYKLLAYCLMGNHFHLLIKQSSDIPVSKLMSKLMTSYAMYFNSKYERIGNLFQDAFKAKAIEEDAYLSVLSAYIHNNPPDPEAYEHSSLQEYLKRATLCDTSIILELFNNSTISYGNYVIEQRKKGSPFKKGFPFEL